LSSKCKALSTLPHKKTKTKQKAVGQELCFTSIIPVAQEVEVGRLKFEASLGKVNGRLYLKNKLKEKGLGCGSNGRVLV
jgi:hypothetical protein